MLIPFSGIETNKENKESTNDANENEYYGIFTTNQTNHTNLYSEIFFLVRVGSCLFVVKIAIKMEYK